MSDQERLIQVWRATCEALQGVVRDLKVTQEELLLAGRFFNRLGQSGMFPSILNVGVGMTSVDVHRVPGSGTRPNMLGPFYKPGAPVREDGNLIETSVTPDTRLLYLDGVVSDATSGKPLAGVELDFWQADNSGVYDHGGFNLCGVIRTDEHGRYSMKTVVPRDYSDHDNDPIGELFRAMGRHNRRAAHLHLKVRAAGYVPLITQIFMPDSDYLDSDYVEGAVSADLTLTYRPHAGDNGNSVDSTFDLSLQRLPT